MNTIDKEPERHEIEVLLPWYAAGTLSRCDADLVERALARDSELARRYDLVRQELAETIQLNEALGAPSARVMEKLFAAIDAEEASSARRRRRRISRTPSRATASILNSDAPARSARERRLSE
jgi:anti-sigma-K factor RskA